MLAFITRPLLDFGNITGLFYYTRKDHLRMAKLFFTLWTHSGLDAVRLPYSNFETGM